MYLYVNEDLVLFEKIPDENPIFPNIPIEDRYPKEFLDKCIYMSDDEAAKFSTGMIYHPDFQTFLDPPVVEPAMEPEVNEESPIGPAIDPENEVV